MSRPVCAGDKVVSMKPNFALSLSMDGIGLLHRAHQGWHFVSEVDPESPDLANALQALRDKAMALDVTGLRTKLVIPNEQIKYLDFDALGATGDDLAQAVRAALDGATPYSIEELAYDWSIGAGQVQVAAVTLETLTEAEAFAVEHGFNPLSFVAIPHNGDFVGEPYFGETQHVAGLLAEGDGVERDNSAIRVLGTAHLTEHSPPAPSEEVGISATASDIPVVDPAAELPPLQHDDAPDSSPEPALIIPPETSSPATDFADLRATRGDVPDVAAPQTSATQNVPTPAARPEFADRAIIPSPAAASLRATPTAAGAAVQSSPELNALETPQIGGKPRHLGLILTILLLLFLAGAAAWASLFLDDGIAGLFRRSSDTQITAAPEPAGNPEAEADREIARLPVSEPETFVTSQPLTQDTLSPDEALASYAATGIWQVAPDAPQPASPENLENLYRTSIDRSVAMLDAVALPDPNTALHDPRPATPASPPAPDARFEFDTRGLVIATKDGALTPEGVRVYAGRPAITPPPAPEREAHDDTTDTADTATITPHLAAIRPRLRPADLSEQNERSTLNGLTRAELAALRPRMRPESLQAPTTQPAATATDPDAIAAAVAEATITPDAQALASAAPQAVASSLKPRLRPREIRQASATQPESQPSTEPSVAATATPNIPTTASVARQATEKNVLKLNKVNLIGVYGNPSSRRALVRLPNGRYKKVQVGDRLDGGKVAAIGANELRYVKRGRNVVLQMPKS